MLKLFRKLLGVTHAVNNEAVKPATQIVAKAGTVMLYEVIATGERIHLLDGDTTRALVATGHIRPFVKQPWRAPLTPAIFSIQEEYSTGALILCANCPTCKQSYRWPGIRPDAVDKVRFFHCGHVGGEAVPAEAQARYQTINPDKVGYPVTVEGSKSCPENNERAAELQMRQEKAGGVL